MGHPVATGVPATSPKGLWVAKKIDDSAKMRSNRAIFYVDERRGQSRLA
jgi:hypothetical protein